MVYSGRKQVRIKNKNTLRKNFENDFKNMDLTWGMAERDKQKREIRGEKVWLYYPQWIEGKKRKSVGK